MTLSIGGFTFEEVTYDEDADVLYLRNQKGAPVQTLATPEGHAVKVDADGSVVGMTIVNARWLAERDGAVLLSMPAATVEVSVEELGTAMETVGG